MSPVVPFTPPKPGRHKCIIPSCFGYSNQREFCDDHFGLLDDEERRELDRDDIGDCNWPHRPERARLVGLAQIKIDQLVRAYAEAELPTTDAG